MTTVEELPLAAIDVVSTPVGEEFTAVASLAQERIWFAGKMAADRALYLVIDEICLGNVSDPAVVADALGAVIGRHEALRTSLVEVDGELRQRIHAQVRGELLIRDLINHPQWRENLIPVEQIAPVVAVDDPPLWRALLSIHSEDDWRLHLVIHHAIADAASMVILRGELTELCAAIRDGREVQLAELPIHYADFAAWHRDQVELQLAELDAFWHSALDGMPAVHNIATDRPRSAERSFGGADVYTSGSETLLAAATALARSRRCSDFMVFAATYVAAIARWSDRTDIVVGLPVTGRDRAELHSVVGMFVNMVVLRVDASGDPTVAELIDRTRSATLDALEHQQMPLQRIVQRHTPQREPGVPPVYQLTFNFLPMDLRDEVSSAEDDLACEVGIEPGGRLAVRLEYNTALFDESTVRTLAAEYVDLLQFVVTDPDRRLSDLPAGHRPAQPAPEEAPVAAADGEAVGTTDDALPLSALEELVATVWSELLDRPHFGRTDEFFASGGHSLLALRVIGRLREAAQVELSIQDFFADTTVAGVAATVERAMIAQISGISDDEARRLAGTDDD